MAERLLVRDLMSVGVATCPPDTPIVEIARLLLDKQLEGIVVLDQEGNAVGSISRDELVQAYTRDDCRDLTAEDVMRDSVPQIPPDVPLIVAAQIMRDKSTRVVFLMHQAGGIQYPAAALSYTNILRHLAARSDAELQDLGTAAARKLPLETFIEKRDAAQRQSHIPPQE
ncbi:MAG: CBS domain-containing protein [Chloroflexi bacterium]|nr:CBS domain-containing protein [Chloroflexota bacterium]MCL5274274.1 CBS domain-containing protein [Chloroflexota bacterium]